MRSIKVFEEYALCISLGEQLYRLRIVQYGFLSTVYHEKQLDSFTTILLHEDLFAADMQGEIEEALLLWWQILPWVYRLDEEIVSLNLFGFYHKLVVFCQF